MKRIALTLVVLSTVVFINATSPMIGAGPAQSLRGGEASGRSIAADKDPAKLNSPAAPLLFWRTDGASGTWTGPNWSNPASATGGTGWTAGNDAEFTAGSTLTFVTGTLFGNVKVNDGLTVTVTAAGTASAGPHIYDIGSGALLTWPSQNFTASGTSFVKNGEGTWNLGSISNAYNGGFTLNSGTVVVTGTNSLGGISSPLTINGGTIDFEANDSNKTFPPTSIVIGGDFEFTGSATKTATFSGAVNLGAATRTLINTSATSLSFPNVISGGSGAGLFLSGVGTTILSGANTYTGPTTIGDGVLSISTVANGGASSGIGASTNSAANLVFDGGTLRYTGFNASTNRNFTINGGKTAIIDVTENDLTLAGGSAATDGALEKTGTGVLNLAGTNLHTGDTIAGPGGALALIGSGSIASSQVIEIKGGGFFDVGSLSIPFTMANGQGLRASGTATSGTIATVAGKGLTTAPDSPLVFTAYNGTTAPLTIQGTGAVTLAGGNPVTVNTTAALGVGDRVLIAKGSAGTVNGVAPTSLTIGGSGLAPGTSGSLVITGGQLVLRVTAGDVTPPETTIDSSEPDPTNDATGDFTFSSNEPGTFECSVDGGAFAGCSSPFSTAALADGPHTFAVRAVDAALNVDPTPATHSWTVDTAAPQTTIDTMPTNPSSDPTGDFTFSSTEAGTFECSVDGGGFVGCSSPFATASLANGPHTFAVRATDAAGNTDLTPASFTWTVSAAASFNGPVSVGTGEAITSLTNAGGLFEQMNAGTISGNVTVNITSDLTTETGTHALNQLAETGAGGYTIFFQASGGPRLIEGTSAAGLITLNGADRVTFSGLAFGPGGLTIRNLGTGQAFRFANDAANNSIVSCEAESGGTVIFFANGSVTGNDNNAVSNSLIRARNTSPIVSGRAVQSDASPSIAVTNSNLSVADNTIVDAIVELLDADNFSITGNSFTQTVSRDLANAIGVDRSGGTNLISRNSISNFTIDGIFAGVALGEVGSTTVSQNRIFNIEGTNDPSFTSLSGIVLNGSTTSPSSVTIENNMISIAPSDVVQGQIYGIHDRSNTGDSVSATHNTILLGGPSTGSPDSYGFLRSVSTPSSVSLVNNIFFNNRGTGAANYAVGDWSPGQGSWSSDFNLFVGTGPATADFFSFGGAPVDFAMWKAGPPARDANSIAGVLNSGPFNVGNMFTSDNDLHLSVGGNNPAINNATNAGVSTDFDGQSRPFNGVPDIGADEVQTAPTAAEASIGGRVVTASGRGIPRIRIIVSGGGLLQPRTVVTNLFGYYRIDGLRVGEAYVVGAGGKRYVFETPSRVVSLGGDALDVEFTGELR